MSMSRFRALPFSLSLSLSGVGGLLLEGEIRFWKRSCVVGQGDVAAGVWKVDSLGSMSFTASRESSQ